MKYLLLALCLTSLLPGAARAGDSVPAIEVKQKSNFDAANARDPFWPIGWKRPGPKNPNANAGPDLSPNAFSLTSVTIGTGAHFAIRVENDVLVEHVGDAVVDGVAEAATGANQRLALEPQRGAAERADQEGQQFGLQLGTQVYQVTLRSIEDGQVILVWQDNEIVVPLRRK